MSCRIFLFLLLFGLSSASADTSLVKKGDRIVFLGDSNTYAAHYVNFIEASLLTQAPGLELEILNLGLSSETTSGLSEPDHPFPRPCVHERLDRVLEKTKPDVVVAGYGMNDGMYYPQSPERMAAYQKGINDLIAKVHATGAKLILLTPPPFDPLPMKKKGKLLPATAEKFAWFSIFEDYDSVLADYSNWLSALKDDRVDLVIDVRGPMVEYTETKRKENPDFVMSGDGVHFNQEGHRILAGKILTAWGFDPDVEVDPELQKLVSQRQILLRDAWLTHCGHKRPKTKQGLPLAEAQKKAAEITAKMKQ
ncbi:MAG: SGNH/GDSL hydrolase family protein [Verrucomicrobiales bacterium]|nr:SGNH/GDSL hydrolase family protein [Verrucomicrobiales bacterium]